MRISLFFDETDLRGELPGWKQIKNKNKTQIMPVEIT